MMCSQEQLTKFEATGRNRNVTVIREFVDEGNSKSEEDMPVLVEECSMGMCSSWVHLTHCVRCL